MKLRSEIKIILSKLKPENRLMFKRMYSPNDLGADVNDVVNKMDLFKLPHALNQCINTYNKNLNSNKMKDSQKLLLRMAAAFLIKKNGSTTTLEIKDSLRERFPKMSWTQDQVSQEMQEIYDNNEFKDLQFEDTGEFRVYHLGLPTLSRKDQIDPNVVLNSNPQQVNASGNTGNTQGWSPSQTVTKVPKKTKAVKPVGTTTNLSRTAIVDLMKESKGRFYTVTFIKKDKTVRTINGQTKKSNFMDNLGYINFRESNGNQRRVNPQTITEISISGNVYKVK